MNANRIKRPVSASQSNNFIPSPPSYAKSPKSWSQSINEMDSFARSITRFTSLTLLQQIYPLGAGRISSNHIFIFPPISGFPLCV